MAVLYGNESLGAFRFDLLMEGSKFDETKSDGSSRRVTNAPQIALSYGSAFANGMEFYAQIGFKFADMEESTYKNTDDKEVTDTELGESKLAFQAGISMPLTSGTNSESSFSVDFVIGNKFGGINEGTGFYKDAKAVYGGVFLVGADVGYKQVITLDKLSFGFRPNVGIGLTIDDSGSLVSGSKETYDGIKTTLFELSAGVNLGVKYQISPKFNLYTGIGLEIINWQAGSYSEGADAKYDKDDSLTSGYKSSAWKITGFNWKPETLTSSSSLGFGLTYAPTENIVIGAGLNTLLDKIVYFDFEKMQFGTALNTASSDGTELGWLSSNIFGGLTFDLTITAKF